MLMQTRDEETAKYFKQASSQVPVQKRTQQLWRKDFLGFERFQKADGATEGEQLEYRALDHHIKNLGKGYTVKASMGHVRDLPKSKLGVETIFMGFGLEDDRVHSPNEKFELECLRMGTRSHAMFIDELKKL